MESCECRDTSHGMPTAQGALKVHVFKFIATSSKFMTGTLLCVKHGSTLFVGAKLKPTGNCAVARSDDSGCGIPCVATHQSLVCRRDLCVASGSRRCAVAGARRGGSVREEPQITSKLSWSDLTVWGLRSSQQDLPVVKTTVAKRVLKSTSTCSLSRIIVSKSIGLKRVVTRNKADSLCADFYKTNKSASALEPMVILVSVLVGDGQHARDSDHCAFCDTELFSQKQNNIKFDLP